MSPDDQTILQNPNGPPPVAPSPTPLVNAPSTARTERTDEPRIDDRTAQQGETGRSTAQRRSAEVRRPKQFSFSDGTPPTVPGYEPIRKLGEGTFGIVWLYEAQPSGKLVAIKFFTHGTTQQWQLLQAEIMQLARLYGDPGIVQLQDLEPDANPPYCILTYAEGGSLADRLAQGPMPVAEALQIFSDAASALAYVHAKGIIHCDLKPGNVLRDARGKALLADFGQAQLASDLTPSLGTFFYMAPEQAELGASIPDTRWDVYALGALFHAMVTGQAPRENTVLRAQIAHTPGLDTRLKLYREWVRTAPPPTAHRRLPGMDRRLADIIDACLAVDPAHRLRDGGAIVEALHHRTHARRQRPVLIFGLLVPLLMLLVGAVAAINFGRGSFRGAESALIDRHLESSEVAARLVANVLDDKLDDRFTLLSTVAGKNELRHRLAASSKHDELQPFIDEFRMRLDEFRSDNNDEAVFFKVFLADREGKIVADDPEDATLYDKSWAWRDWFNGTGDKHEDRTKSYPIHDRPHVSQPYLYRGATADETEPLLVVSLSVPVVAPDNKSVIGRLVGVVRVRDLHHWLEGVGFHKGHGSVVLVNDQRHCLLHHEQAKLRERLPRNAPPEPLPDNAILEKMRTAKEHGTEAMYHDPLDDKDYLAGFAPLRKRGWGVIVQYERDATLQPAQDLAKWMRYFGAVALFVALLFILGMWTLLRRMLRQHEERKELPV